MPRQHGLVEGGFTDIQLNQESSLSKKLYRQRYLFFMLIPCIIWGLIYLYMPLYGSLMAFMRYNPGREFFDNPWVGLEHFRYFLLQTPDFWQVVRNSLVVNMLALIFQLPLSITLAIILSELPFPRFAKISQTISYLPNFISWPVVAALFFQLLSMNGWLNSLLVTSGLIRDPIFFLGKPELTWPILTFTSVWKHVGFQAIIFLGAIAAIDPSLHEAAYVDGADKFKRIWHIILPSILPTISVILILSVGYLISTGFDQYFLFGNPSNREFSDVIATYVYRHAFEQGQFSFSTAVGLFQSVVSFTLLYVINIIMKKLTGNSLF